MADPRQDIDRLHQRWVHSYEEDTDTESVYRPNDFDFPPARGRTGFELLADGSSKCVGIAAADGSMVSEGTWELEDEGDDLRIRLNCAGNSEILSVVSVDRDRLTIRKDSDR